MRVSEDYAGSFISATWLAKFLKEHDLKELAATIKSVRSHEFKKGEKPKYVLSFVGKDMEAPVNTTNAFAIANDLGDDTENWPGNKVVMSTSYGQTPNGMGPIMHIRGVITGEQASVAVPSEDAKSAQGNGADNAYAAASQPAKSRKRGRPTNSEPQEQASSASADLNDEIPF